MDTGPIYDLGMAVFGDLMAQGERQVKRPDYTSATSSESVEVHPSLRMRVDRGGATSAHPQVTGASYYIVCPVNRSLLQPGDVLIKSGVPTIVIQQRLALEDCLAVQMEEIGRITTAKDRDAFTNVRFDYLSPPAVISGLDSSMEDSIDFGMQRIIIWTRVGVRKAMRLIDDANDKIWFIEQVIPSGNLLVLQATERAA